MEGENKKSSTEASINFRDMSDNVELLIESNFLTLSTAKLIALAESLGIDNSWSEFAGPSQRIIVIKCLRNFIDVNVDGENFTYEDKHSMLRKVQLMIEELTCQMTPKIEPVASNVPPEDRKFFSSSFDKPKLEHESETNVVESQSLLSALAKEGSIIRRELKICGQIGEVDQKDKLTFVGVSMQIREAHRRGHSDMEIVNAVIKAMSPSLPVRKYLEASICEITLPILKKFLRSHFNEKTATELYQELTNLTQGQDEDALSFVWRALALRSKVNAASEEEEDSMLKYSQGLVQGITMNAIETGLRDENIRSQIRPLLKSSARLSDVELTTQLHSIMLSEQSRSNKINSAAVSAAALAAKGNLKKNAGIKKVTFEDQQSGELLAVLSEVKAKLSNVDELHKTVAELQAEIRQLKVKEKKDGYVGATQQTRRLPVCKNCAEKNEQRCGHCRRCGGENHIARDCRQRADTSGK